MGGNLVSFRFYYLFGLFPLECSQNMYALIAICIIQAIDWTPTGFSTPYTGETQFAGVHYKFLQILLNNCELKLKFQSLEFGDDDKYLNKNI